MSNARELALLEKWADIASIPGTTTTPLSSPPTPKATTFCCCPNRRRYNLKGTPAPIKSTLHPRNIFIDNDFKYIDDVSQENDSECDNNGSIRTCHDNSSTTETINLAAAAFEEYDSDYDDIKQVAGDDHIEHNNFKLKQATTNIANANGGIKKPKIGAVTNDQSTAESCLQTTQRNKINKHNEQPQQFQLDEVTIQRLSNNTISNKQNTATPTATLATGTGAAINDDCSNKENYSTACNNCRQLNFFPQPEKMTIATTTNALGNRSKRSGDLSGSPSETTATGASEPVIAATTPTTTTGTARKTSQNFTLPLTIAGTTPSTSAVAASVALSMPQSPTTPTKTVIKTVLVKRSPITDTNETTMPMASKTTTTTAAAATSPTSPVVCRNNVQRSWENGITNSTTRSEPRYSVKDRIAAIVAGNVQNKQHDNSIKYKKIQCNNNINNNQSSAIRNPEKINMTNSTKSAIKTTSSQQEQPHQKLDQAPTTTNQLLISNNKCTTSSAVTATATTTTTTSNNTTRSTTTSTITTTSVSNSSLTSTKPATQSLATTATSIATINGNNKNKLLQLNDDDIELQRQMLLTQNTGCATLPRRRVSYGHSLSYNSSNNHGSNTAKSMTATTTATTAHDKNNSSQNADKKMSANDVVSLGAAEGNASFIAGSNNGKLSALDNLDLALHLELNDDDGEDPYYALEAYLEKVKHEINEVFELHKARQRMQKVQEQQNEVPEAAASKSPSSTIAATTGKTLSSDELTCSIESDSGFDSASASGNILNYSNNSSISSNINNISGISNNTSSGNSNKLPPNGNNVPSSSATKQPPPPPTRMTKLKALPPPPCSEEADSATSTLKRSLGSLPEQSDSNTNEDVNIWANKLLKNLDKLMATNAENVSANNGSASSSSASSSPTSKTSPMLLSAAATAAIKSRYGGQRNSNSEQTTITQNGIRLRPEKHATIPLQSFNLDCGRIDNAAVAAKTNIAYMRTLSAPNETEKSGYAGHNIIANKARHNRNSLATFNVTEQQHQQRHNQLQQQQLNNEQCTLTNNKCNEDEATMTPKTTTTTATGSPTTILKIEEASAAAAAIAAGGGTTAEELLKTRRQRQLENDMEIIRTALLQQTEQLSAMEAEAEAAAAAERNNCNSSSAMATLAIPKRERINHAAGRHHGTDATGNVYLLASSGNSSDPMTKKGSTSTIWTSEESILRSVGAVDEDNNSTSSSACDEAAGVLSSGKSGISLDSSGLDNDNNESGIGTATPPKDMLYWKAMHHHQHDAESVSSFDALRKMKFQKSGSVVSSDDPDLLEVLSLCDETPNADAEKESPDNVDTTAAEETANDADEDDEGHDEFETIPFCDCDCTDGDISSTSGASGAFKRAAIGAGDSASKPHTMNSVVLRRKCTAAIMVPYASSAHPKCRSHSLDTSSLPTSAFHQHHHNFGRTHAKLHHLQQRGKDHLSLVLRQEPFQSMMAPHTHFNELPSPSSASLHSGHESIGIQELTTKSNSAPLLLKQERKRDDFAGQKLTLRYSRSQSDRYLAEIEAVEACKWLRAAGFPQYAQMYEDHQFPIDLTNVAKDHTNLENDPLQSLYRRLCILNRCANMRLDQSHKPQTPQQKEDSDDENFALSENWTFQPHIRRWSRIGEMGLELPPATKLNVEKTESSSKESSPDRYEDEEDEYDITGATLSLILPTKVGIADANTSSGSTLTGDSADSTLNESAEAAAVRLRRTGSERFKDGAKALLRRVESIKSRRRKRQNREGIVISGPHALDLSQLGQRHSARKPDAVYSTPPSPSAVSPMHTFPKSPFFGGNELKVPSQSDNYLHPHRTSPKRTPTTPRSMRTSPLHFFQMPHLKEGKSDDSSSYYSDSQESSAGGKLTLRKTPSKARRFLQRTGKVDDIGTHSDSECHQGRKLLIKDANANNTEVTVKKLQRGGSLNLGKDPKKREGFRSSSFRSRSTTRKEPKPEENDGVVKRTPVVRWHSFQMEERPHMIFRKCFSQKLNPNSNEHGIPFAAMSAGQLQIIRKLALVILTGYMERYCPTHRSGWNWELPKFIKKIKMPDYRDKRVFGVPLLLILQRTGQTLPVAVRSAFRWLQLNALDQIGLFRKSGVKSRIIKLKELIEYSESTSECMDVFDTQQAYDVADMLKQYFRDLPESLLTTKMSETFAAIFQHLPPEVRLDAVQCAVLLLPDENRETLYALLEFLTLVAANASYNQMTTNNLAVCLAPSLFHNSISTGAASVSASPRRRGKGSGVPDAKELSEAKASHECLSFMIDNYKQIFTASKDKIGKCNFGYMEESKPVPLEALGEGMQFHNWRGYLYECTSATIKEGREKTRGWFTVASPHDPQVDIAYKKVGDGHPLRLWRCVTEIEGPPKEVLDYIIRQRASWDSTLLQCQTVKKLDERTEIFQYALDGQFTTDFCVLRSWQTDLPRGACVIVETSIDHAKAKPLFGAIRGVVLASRYLIEPCGSGRSRVMHLARVDIKGKTPEWYNKCYGHICSHFLSKIRLAFKHVADGPESKV